MSSLIAESACPASPPPESVRLYLHARACELGEIEALGATVISPAEAARRGGFKHGSFARWGHALWLPTLLADGTRHAKRGEILLLRGGEFGTVLERERLSVDAGVAPNLATFFPFHSWKSPGRVVLAESWIKGYIAYRAGKGKLAVIALNGVDGFRSNGHLVENLRTPPWGQNKPDVIFAYDTPRTGHRDSERGITEAKRRAMRDLEPFVRGFYDAQLPQPPQAGECLGLDDYVARTGSDAALALLIDSAAFLGGGIDPAPYLATLPLGFASATVEEPLAVIPGLLPCRSGVLFAPGFQRKSTLAMLIAAHVSLGREIFGRPVSHPGRVLYVTGEDERDDIQRTLKFLIDAGCLKLSNADEQALRDNFRILDVTEIPGVARLTRKGDGGWAAGELLPLVDAAVEGIGGAVLIVLDTLSALGLSETDGMNEAAAAYHRAANGLAREHKACVLGIHHTGKTFAQERKIDMYGARGASALVDGARFAVQLQRDTGSDEEMRSYPAPESISVQDRRGEAPATTVLRLHIHKMRWSAYEVHSERPLWVRTVGWRYETFAALGQQAAARRVDDVQRIAASEQDERDEQAVLDAIHRYAAGGARVNSRTLDGLTVHSGGKKIGQKRVRAIAERCVGLGLLVCNDLPGRGSPKVYSLPIKKY